MYLTRPNAGWLQQQSLDSAGQNLNNNHISTSRPSNNEGHISSEWWKPTVIYLMHLTNDIEQRRTQSELLISHRSAKKKWANNNFTVSHNIYIQRPLATIPKHLFGHYRYCSHVQYTYAIFWLVGIEGKLKLGNPFHQLKAKGSKGSRTQKLVLRSKGEEERCGERAVREEWGKKMKRKMEKPKDG